MLLLLLQKFRRVLILSPIFVGLGRKLGRKFREELDEGIRGWSLRKEFVGAFEEGIRGGHLRKEFVEGI